MVLFGRLLGTLLGNGLPLMKNILKPVAKSGLILLGLTTTASAADAGIQKKTFGSGTAKLLISNEEMEVIIKIVESPKNCGLLITGFTQTVKN